MDIVQETVKLRPYLWAVAYNMTGQVMEAEDIVQDCIT
jgi:DNA-directed RNA polymerase specialized sigma24 family protein